MTANLFIAYFLSHYFTFLLALVIPQILSYVHPLLGNVREIGNYTTAVAKQWSVNSNSRTGFFCAVRADGCVFNNGIRYVTTKQQLQCNS
jgi:hypothetical protein